MPKLEEINAELKAAKIGVQIQQRGDRLSLVATLPPKPGSEKTTPYQQRIALGIYANPAGYKRAKAEALALGGLVATKQFSWATYLKEEASAETAGEWIERFEKDYFDKRSRNAKTQTTWKSDYEAMFKKLDPSKVLTKQTILNAVLETEPDSITRRRACMAFAGLAKFAGIEISLTAYRGKYSPQERNLPTDEEIYAAYPRFNLAWRWVYGMIATFGLRPHEVFYVDLGKLDKDTPKIYILDGKTGGRSIWAFPVEWWEEWRLWEPILPPVTARNNSDYGKRVGNAFFLKDVNFCPYDLRHAWAIRTLFAGLEITIAAQQMGHSVSVHADTYHRWITEKQHEEAWRRLNSR